MRKQRIYIRYYSHIQRINIHGMSGKSFLYRFFLLIVFFTAFSLSLCAQEYDPASAPLFANDAEEHYREEKNESHLLNRIYNYSSRYGEDVGGKEVNFYMKYDYRTLRRNFTLITIPNMYPLSHGNRNYAGETYGTIRFSDISDYQMESQLTVGTISHYRKIMPVLLAYITPNIYGTTLIHDFILSPFNRDNHRFYLYTWENDSSGLKTLRITPRIRNTQLVKGHAQVDSLTGRIVSANLIGNFDMIDFYLKFSLNRSSHSVLPERCELLSNFHFMGNKIASKTIAVFGCPYTLNDSIVGSRPAMELMDSLRPEPLTAFEKSVYRRKELDEAERRQKGKKASRLIRLKDVAWDVVGDHLTSSLEAKNKKAFIQLSPLVSPMAWSYSQRKGMSYRIKLGSRYNFDSQHSIGLDATVGYNFKTDHIYTQVPLRFTFNEKRKGWVELTWMDGNRITNSDVLEKIKDERVDTIDFDRLGLDYFRDHSLQLSGNLQLFRHLQLNTGAIFHRRSALNGHILKALGKPHVYYSFAPILKLTFDPSPQWPILSLHYERGLDNVFYSDTKYERVELDASYTKDMSRLRKMSFRLGGGLYTDRSSDFFVDYTNFRENYLPDGWDDDWTGRFQLLRSEWYNASRYYLRANYTYESPLLFLSWLPRLGYFVETERLYASAAQIEGIEIPYLELGYGFTNRWFSTGIFSSFANGKFLEIGAKFTVELFRNW